MKKWKTVIEAHVSPFHVPWKELWNYRDLCRTFIRKNFITRYTQTVLGPFYRILSPLLTSGLFTLIFGRVVGVSTEGAPKFLFYMLGNLMWGMFANSFYANSNVFTGNAYIMGKVYFPRLIVPISNLLTHWIDAFVQFFLFIVFYMVFRMSGNQMECSPLVLLVPLWLVLLSFLGFGFALIVTSLTVKYRDLHVVTGFVMKIFMYASPILYPVSSIDGKAMRQIAFLNPLASFLEMARFSFFKTGYVSAMFLGYSILIIFLVLFAGIVLFNMTERTFIDTV